MRELAERTCFVACLSLGRLLRSGRYAKTRIVDRNGGLQVLKYRLFYAPLLIWLGGLLTRLLNAGVWFLPQQDWVKRERRLYQILHRSSIRIEDDGTLILPCLPGKTLATLLEDTELGDPDRKSAIVRAAVALADLHHLGFTHGDAMAENVNVDVEAGVAHWFDFESIHDSNRTMTWQRADDVRALLTTCLVRTDPDQRAETLQLILDAYADVDVTRTLVTGFTSVFRRPLIFHLGQAPLSLQSFREIKRLLIERMK